MQGRVRDFLAIAVYHSALTFWAFGVLGLRPRHNQCPRQQYSGEDRNRVREDGFSNVEEVVRLDVEEGPATKSFIAFGRGVPCFSTTADAGPATRDIARLCEPQSVMTAIVKVLRAMPCVADKDMPPPPPLVENLSQLITGLGDAARGV